MTITAPLTLNVNDVEYPVGDFSQTVQNLLGIRTEWANDLQQERLAVAKTEAALRALDVELAEHVNKEIAAAETTVEEAPAPKKVSLKGTKKAA